MTDNQLLMILQCKYKQGDRLALTAIYEKLYEIACKTINSRSETNGHIAAMSQPERMQKAHDATAYIIEQYLRRPDFEIDRSMTGYLYKRIDWELFGRNHQNKRDQIVTYTDTVPDRGQTGKKYKYLVENLRTGEKKVYGSVAELYLNPAFRTLRKKRLAEAIRTGRKWKHYIFDLLEENG